MFSRCKDQLPSRIDEQEVAGINRRFRIYKYNHGNVYRPHVDGAWPGSGIVDGEYQYNMFGDRLSRLTFILYLNEDFEGGATTFFSPSAEFGNLNTIGVVLVLAQFYAFLTETPLAASFMKAALPPAEPSTSSELMCYI